MKNYINIGYTNISYEEKGFFYQEKKYDEFNHKLNYEFLKNFDFVPELVSQINDINKWKFIETQDFELDDDNLKKIAQNFKKIHNSNLDFPPFNVAARIKSYHKVMNEKKIKIPQMEKYFKKINFILRKMDKNTPCHNDLYKANIIVEKNTNQMFFVDWEYAAKGDKHFDLAYFIESCALTDEQETFFLEAYENNYEYSYILQQRFLVNYLIVLWLVKFDNPPFSPQPFINKLDILDKMYKDWINKNK